MQPKKRTLLPAPRKTATSRAMSSAPSAVNLPAHPGVNNMFRNTSHRPLYWLPNTMCEPAIILFESVVSGFALSALAHNSKDQLHVRPATSSWHTRQLAQSL
jgi:hypothetical protein